MGRGCQLDSPDSVSRGTRPCRIGHHEDRCLYDRDRLLPVIQHGYDGPYRGICQERPPVGAGDARAAGISFLATVRHAMPPLVNPIAFNSEEVWRSGLATRNVSTSGYLREESTTTRPFHTRIIRDEARRDPGPLFLPLIALLPSVDFRNVSF